MKTNLVRIFFLIFLCSGIIILPAGIKAAGKSVSVENGKIRLTFDGKTGTFTGLSDLVGSYDFLNDKPISCSLWEIDLQQSARFDTLSIDNATDFHFSKPDPLTLVLEWDKFKGEQNGNLKVKAIVTLEKDKPFSSWKIFAEGIEGKLINRIVFPRISGIKNLGDEFLAVPQWMGAQIKDPRTNLLKLPGSLKKYEWSYPGQLALQCLALYNPAKIGFYASCNDSLAFAKDFSILLDRQENMVFQMSNYPSLDSTISSYSPNYSTIIGTFKGDWLTAALIYREWGSKQRWCNESRFKSRQTPEWLEKTALWEWNRGKSQNVLLPASDLKQRLGLPVNVFWHWWHGCSYDDGFPDYMPPREGKESFNAAISSAGDNGIRTIVYMNQALWGTTTQSWKSENAETAAAKDVDGNTMTHVFNKFTNKPAAYMCMGTQFWKDKYSSLCDSAVNTYRVNGVYMDMACLSLKCYDKSHGHPIGGGNYWIKNFARITNQIRSKIPSDKQPVLAGEGCGEVWLPYLDLFLTLEMSRERYAGVGGWETIPFFQAVYHQYSITYGNYSSLTEPPYDELWPIEFAPREPLKLLDKKFNKQFLMEQARSFVWGIQPTIANYQTILASERKEEVNYILDLAKARNRGLDFLLKGKFLKSPEIKSPSEEFDISRLSIYAGKTGNTVTTFRGTFPLIYSGTWQSDDKRIGIALASISDDPFKVSFTMYSDDYKLPGSGKIFIIDAEGKKFLTPYSGGKVQVDFVLKPRGLCIVEISN